MHSLLTLSNLFLRFKRVPSDIVNTSSWTALFQTSFWDSYYWLCWDCNLRGKKLSFKPLFEIHPYSHPDVSISGNEHSFQTSFWDSHYLHGSNWVQTGLSNLFLRFTDEQNPENQRRYIEKLSNLFLRFGALASAFTVKRVVSIDFQTSFWDSRINKAGRGRGVQISALSNLFLRFVPVPVERAWGIPYNSFKPLFEIRHITQFATSLFLKSLLTFKPLFEIRKR